MGQAISKPLVGKVRLMNEVRRFWLTHLLNQSYGGDRSRFMQAAEITKGRMSQMLKDGFQDTTAKRLVEKLKLQPGYFDRPIPFDKEEILSDEALAVARQYEKMDEAERKRLRWFIVLARNGVEPSHIPPAPPIEETKSVRKAKK
jgi:hypothetical protein